MLRDMALKEQCEIVHEVVRSKGFWDHQRIKFPDDEVRYAPDRGVENPSIWGEKRDLMHSEIAEMTEADRDGNRELEAEECADLLIRLMDYCAARGYDLGQEYINKMRKNIERPHLHGRVF